MSTRAHACFVGNGSMPVRCAEVWQAAGHGVSGVISADPEVLAWAAEAGVPHSTADDDLGPFLRAHPCDFLFQVAHFGAPPPAVLRLPRVAAINFHDGPLPRWAGRHVTSWAILEGVTEHGITWHGMLDPLGRGDAFVDRATGRRGTSIDTGPVYARAAVEVAPDDTAFTLNARCWDAGVESFAEIAERVKAGTLGSGEVQELAERRWYGKYERPAAGGLLDWRQPAVQTERLVRALEFGPVEQPLGRAKFLTGTGALCVRAAAVEPEDGSASATGDASDADVASAAPGTILSVEDDALVVATGEGALRVTRITSPGGRERPVRAWADVCGWRDGARLPVPDDDARARVTRLHRRTVRAEESWVNTLAGSEPLTLAPRATADAVGDAPREECAVELPAEWPATCAALGREPADLLAAAWALALARLHRRSDLILGVEDATVTRAFAQDEALFARVLPWRCRVDVEASWRAGISTLADALAAARDRGPHACDLFDRMPALRALPRRDDGTAVLDARVRFGEVAAQDDAALALHVAPDGDGATVHADPRRADAHAVAEAVSSLVQAFASGGDVSVGALPLVRDAERARLEAWGRGEERAWSRDATIPAQFVARARRSPEGVAVRDAEGSVTYAELAARAHRIAQRLRELGIGRGATVGVLLGRSARLPAAMLGIQEAGAAYLPLDERHPEERCARIAQDAGLAAVVTERALLGRVPECVEHRVVLDVDAERLRALPAAPPADGPRPEDLAYVMVTSGSTGEPKGVTVEHRQVVSFFVAMDETVGADAAARLLAVTRASFDISVLELLWTLTRGIEVVMHRGEDLAAGAAAPEGNAAPLEHATRPLDFSLFYFAADATADDPYRLLLEGARYADAHGFRAVWTPERHFHEFGGLYPNPAVSSAALAMITERVELRAGSCVTPLHDPLRVAEEWAVVDRLSGGRSGIAMASGWHPQDFALRPEAYEARHELLREGIGTLRHLWGGGKLRRRDGRGEEVEVGTLPRPVRRQPAIWITAAGNPKTFELAGREGCHVLTHLLGSSLEDLAELVARYRRAWQEAGHPGRGTVTLMLHTYVGESTDEARERARAPMKRYLRSAVSLVEKAAWEWPRYRRAHGAAEDASESSTPFRPEDLSEEDREAILDFAFERYFEGSGLFGDVARCTAFADRVKGADVDEIACLCDFGVEEDAVLAMLPRLREVHERSNRAGAEAADSVHGMILAHEVTHLQCTPSMARMLVRDPEAHAALARLQVLLVGGEALPAPLARELKRLVGGRVINVYGPTETTVWSTAHELSGEEDPVPIGRPLANARAWVVDDGGALLPRGAVGELLIGGPGVARGYLHRPELTAERFVSAPADAASQEGDASARAYRAGDLVRWNRAGLLEFHGRADHQVKLRGHRIELGEIESALESAPGVRQAVVVLREDLPGGAQLVAYVVPGDRAADASAWRAHLQRRLPAVMIPAAWQTLDALPLNTSGKVDRGALPAPVHPAEDGGGASAEAGTETERAVAAAWQEVLGVPAVGLDRNFFDLGGHSLLAVQLQIELRERLQREVRLVDVFRHPTVRALAAHLDDPDAADAGARRGSARGEARRAARAALRRPRRGPAGDVSG